MRPPVSSVVQLPPFGRELSTPAGRFRLEADRCLSAARTLEKHHYKNETPHYIILFHAIELGLKAFLIKSGTKVARLRKKPFRHNLRALYAKAVKCGFNLDYPEAESMIEWINEWHDGAKVRYDFDEARDLPTCAEILRLATAIFRASE